MGMQHAGGHTPVIHSHPRSKSRNVNAYVKAVLVRGALYAAEQEAKGDMQRAHAKLTGGQLGEANRMIDNGLHPYTAEVNVKVREAK